MCGVMPPCPPAVRAGDPASLIIIDIPAVVYVPVMDMLLTININEYTVATPV
jgi:hypothetical protein